MCPSPMKPIGVLVFALASARWPCAGADAPFVGLLAVAIALSRVV
jgi:hypothetical protein